MARMTLSAGEARRVALAAQGLGGSREGTVSARSIHAAIARMGVLQIDSVNVFARSHYMPLFSRLGSYDPAALERVVFRRRKPTHVEYMAHEAAFMPVVDWPLWGFRRAAVRARSGRWGGWAADNAGVIDTVKAELAERGPLKPSEIISVERQARGGPWWDWDHVKRSLEYLWGIGEVAIAGRDGFERVYGLAEQVLPADVLFDVPQDDAIRELVRRASRAHGVATVADLDDYYRIRDQKAVRAAVDSLVDSGDLSPVAVEGWNRPAWIHREARVPRAISQTALLTPFDPVVWFRDRAERVFDFSYRIEIYVPGPKRQYGYYSLPLVVDDRIAGRLDLKADRASGTLRVQSAWWEHGGADPARVAAELRRATAWQGLGDITVSRWGNASDDLAAALGAQRHDHPNA
ncbi:winged helix-turn-helix domain-containing protein [Microbacterium sorbitolivorans]|uniref:Winged helix-turn-helix domain-containing protein n=1 Tax=Microbacterium sorbitolivorans TaxID=1867410 RepID=A0A367Y2I6_9MICO|nr:crosslink repair DNA glycosylase YcaQ family protein [Microbacterium sorbitolivorans]RCK59750.1 winged helix-turn-helix domain-containing protein [Microbacterium sorbitolivorans]